MVHVPGPLARRPAFCGEKLRVYTKAAETKQGTGSLPTGQSGEEVRDKGVKC